MEERMGGGGEGFVYGRVSEGELPGWCGGLPELTRRLMTAHYGDDRADISQSLASELYWIGSMEWQMIQGREGVLAELERDAHIPREILDTDFRVIYADPYCCTVSGWMRAKTPESSGMLLAAVQRVTFQYALFDGVPKAVHIHVSNSWDMAEKGEQFPFRAGRESYQYVQEVLRKAKKEPEKLLLRDIHYRIHVAAADEIMLVEARRNHCVFRTVNGEIEVYATLAGCLEKLPECFIRVHRSFIVNANYVVGFHRFTIYLCDGLTVTVPERRYRQIRKKLLEHVIGIGKHAIGMEPIDTAGRER